MKKLNNFASYCISIVTHNICDLKGGERIKFKCLFSIKKIKKGLKFPLALPFLRLKRQ